MIRQRIECTRTTVVSNNRVAANHWEQSLITRGLTRETLRFKGFAYHVLVCINRQRGDRQCRAVRRGGWSAVTFAVAALSDYRLIDRRNKAIHGIYGRNRLETSCMSFCRRNRPCSLYSVRTSARCKYKTVNTDDFVLVVIELKLYLHYSNIIEIDNKNKLKTKQIDS